MTITVDLVLTVSGLVLGTVQILIYLSSPQSYQVASSRISISDEKEAHRGQITCQGLTHVRGRTGIHSLESLA